MKSLALVGFLVIGCAVAVQGRRTRNVEELSRCVRMAEPLVHNPEYVFPLTNMEIHNVCRMWGAFVECVQSYTTHFLTPEQLEAFGAAIEPSMQSIHQLCAEDINYRAAYLEYAPCMKRTYTGPELCGQHYRYLADLVQGSVAQHNLLCCAHQKFRSCVLTATPRECGTTVRVGAAGSPGVTATQFVTSMMDRALGFLLQQCTSYNPSAEECPGFDSSSTNSVRYQQYNISTTTQRYLPQSDAGEREPRFKTHTNFNRDFRGDNSIAAPKTGQFRGVSDTGALATLHWAAPMLMFIVTLIH